MKKKGQRERERDTYTQQEKIGKPPSQADNSQTVSQVARQPATEHQ